MWTFIAGANGDRASRGEQHGGHDIVGDSDRSLGDHVGGRGRDHDRVGGVGEPDMADLGFLRQAEGFGRDRILR